MPYTRPTTDIAKEGLFNIIQNNIATATVQAAVTQRVPMASVKFLSPLTAFLRNPFAVGKNYHEHALEFDKSGFNATSSASAISLVPLTIPGSGSTEMSATSRMEVTARGPPGCS